MVVGSLRGFREVLICLTFFIKHQEIAGVFTATTPNLPGGQSKTEEHISTITDLISPLRDVEMYDEMRRGVTVLNMRRSRQDQDIREFAIDARGMRIGRPFRDVTGILAGGPRHAGSAAIDIVGNIRR